jgi:hypothetical protein
MIWKKKRLLKITKRIMKRIKKKLNIEIMRNNDKIQKIVNDLLLENEEIPIILIKKKKLSANITEKDLSW